MLPEQVVEPVAAGCGLGDQVLVIEAFQATASLARGGLIQRGARVGVDVWPWVQAQAAEQPLLVFGEVAVREAERSGHRQFSATVRPSRSLAAASSAANPAGVQVR